MIKEFKKKLAMRAARKLFVWLRRRARDTDNRVDDMAVDEAEKAVYSVIRRAM